MRFTCQSTSDEQHNNNLSSTGGAAYCLAFILMAGCPSQRCSTDRSQKINHASVEEPLAALISWITSQLQSSASSSLSLVTPTLTALMSCPEARILFANNGGIGYLSRHLRSGSKGAKRSVGGGGSATVQQLYELCFCLWTLTYECNTSSAIRATFARDNAINSLVEIVSSAPREKVIRVALSALRTLASCTAESSPSDSSKKEVTASTFLNEMIGCGLIKYIDQMKERQWTDPDIVDDLTVLHKLLHENFKEMSRWDVYLAEVQSGNLEWGILHTEKFFRENAKRFEGPDSDFSVVKVGSMVAVCSFHSRSLLSLTSSLSYIPCH
jgi:V-type H+-transporting ATPase subunit H